MGNIYYFKWISASHTKGTMQVMLSYAGPNGTNPQFNSKTLCNMLGQMGQNSRAISMSWRNIVEAFF